MESDSTSETSELRRERLHGLVARHSVVFQVCRARIPHDQGLRVIGYDVYLVGRHQAPMISPGCTRCQSIWVDLGVLAHVALPRPGWRTRFSIRPFDHALHYAAGANGPAEVELVVEVRHRSDYSDALDECEDECLSRLVANLRALGMLERSEAARVPV